MSVAVAARPSSRVRARWQAWLAARRRRMIADGFQAVLDDVRHPLRGFTARVPVEREQVLDAQEPIEHLIAHLRDDRRPVDDDAMQLARAILCERGSPLFAPAARGTLRRHVSMVCEAME